MLGRKEMRIVEGFARVSVRLKGDLQLTLLKREATILRIS
jgi:hypothetical protein